MNVLRALSTRWNRIPRWGRYASVAAALLVAAGALFFMRWRYYEVVTDGRKHLVPQKSVRKVIWDSAEKINASDRIHPSIYGAVRDPKTADGGRIAWGEDAGGTNADIVVMGKSQGEWNAPAQIEGINSGFDEWGPAFSPDGDALYFYSNRPGGRGGWDIWVSRRGLDGKWREPENLPEPVNTAADERYPVVDPRGRWLIFSSDRNTGSGDDLFRAAISAGGERPAEVVVEPLAAVNSPYHERRPAISPFGESLFFESDRPGGIGGFDIYRSRLFDEEWLTPENAGERVNSEYNDLQPEIGDSGYRLRFTTDRNASRKDESEVFQSSSREIYEVERVFGLEEILAFLSRLPWQFFAMLASCILSTLLMWLILKWLSPRLDKSSVLQKCFAASIVAHILIWLLMMQWMVEKHMREGRGSEAGLLFAAPSGPVSAGDAPPWEKTGVVALSEQRAELSSMARAEQENFESREIGQELRAPTANAETYTSAPSSANPANNAKSAPSESREQELNLPSVVLRPVQRGVSGGKSSPADTPGAREIVPGRENAGEALNRSAAESARGKGETSLSEWTALASKGSMGESGGGLPAGAIARQIGGTTGPDEGKEGVTGAGEVRPGPVGGLPSRSTAAARSSDVNPGTGGEAAGLRRDDSAQGTGGSSKNFLAEAGKPGPATVAGISKPYGLPEGTPFGERTAPGRESGIKLPARYALRGNPGKNLLEGLKREGAPEEAARKKAEAIDDMVETALRWMAQHQEDDGRWSMTDFVEHCKGTPRCADPAHAKEKGHMQDSAQTGLVLLCFLAKGYTHVDKSPYQESVKRALEYILKNENNGDLRIGGNMYAQGIVTMALGEAYAMTADEQLRKPLENAVRFIIDAQNPKSGGWRYGPRSETSDTSIFGWQIQALKAAEAGGIQFPKTVYANAQKWLDSAKSGKNGGYYGYTGPAKHAAMTAEAMLTKLLMGGDLEGADIREGTEFLMSGMPEWEVPKSQPRRGRTGGGTDLHSASFNVYYWYYATQTLFNLGGEDSAKWNALLFQILKEKQRKDGCMAGTWNPEDIWGTQYDLGRMFTTSMSTLCLEVYYRYLPIYLQRKEGKSEVPR